MWGCELFLVCKRFLSGPMRQMLAPREVILSETRAERNGCSEAESRKTSRNEYQVSSEAK